MRAERLKVELDAQQPRRHGAVDRFAAAMKEKLAKKRAQVAVAGTTSRMPNAFLVKLLCEHVAKATRRCRQPRHDDPPTRREDWLMGSSMDCKNNPCCGDRLSCFGKPKPKFAEAASPGVERETELYRRAADIIRIAMGWRWEGRGRKAKRVCSATKTPLPHGTASKPIVALAQGGQHGQ